MKLYNNDATLSLDDLKVVERLLEFPLPPRCRRSLIDMFGEAGHRAQVHEIQDSYYENCDKPDCFDCDRCAPYQDEPLLYLIVDEVKRYLGDKETKETPPLPF